MASAEDVMHQLKKLNNQPIIYLSQHLEVNNWEGFQQAEAAYYSFISQCRFIAVAQGRRKQ